MRHFLQEWPQTRDIDETTGREGPAHTEEQAPTHRHGTNRGTLARLLAGAKHYLGIRAGS